MKTCLEENFNFSSLKPKSVSGSFRGFSEASTLQAFSQDLTVSLGQGHDPNAGLLSLCCPVTYPELFA